MKKILIVDDDPTFLKLLSKFVIGAGYEVRTARDGRIALNMLKDGSPDLIVLDIMMPVVSGYEVARLIKSDPALLDIPIILFTFYDTILDPEVTIAIGIDYLHKSCLPQKLLEKIEKMLQVKDLKKEPEKGLQERQFERILSRDIIMDDAIRDIIELRVQKAVQRGDA